MLRITDRYILREVIPPFLLALLVFTFLLMIPPIMEVAEDLIAKGVDPSTIVRIMATLVPQGLGITIPISLLLGILMGLGRLSTDRETVALQACGVSVFPHALPPGIASRRHEPRHVLHPGCCTSRCEPGLSGDYVPNSRWPS